VEGRDEGEMRRGGDKEKRREDRVVRCEV